MTVVETIRLGSELETWSVRDVLAWAAERYRGRIAMATGFGAEGCVLIDLVGRHRLGIDLFTLDTGLLFPETYALWRTLEKRYGVTIRAVRPAQTLREQAVEHGDDLWSHEPDLCCRMRKVEPLRRALAGCEAWITAIRRDQTPERAGARALEWDARFGLVKINPLVRWTSRQVWDYLRQHGVPFNPLHDQGYSSIGCVPCTTPVARHEGPRAGRWRGRAKTECGLHAERSP